MLGWSFVVSRHTHLNTVEQLLWYNSRDTVGNNYILKAVFSNVFAVVEHSSNTVNGNQIAPAAADAHCIHGVYDLLHGRAGSIHLDMMFVDEGFGSLDDDSLRLAIATLQELTDGNRLVGIISHVGELKAKIDKQIVVTKELTGGSSCKIVV